MMPTRKNNGWIPDIFNDFFDTEWMPKAKATAPAINVTEDEKKYTVEVAAPGMCKEDFDIQINKNNDLVIKMEKKTSSETGNKEEEKCNCRYLRREFSYTKFQQTLILPEDVDKEMINAKVENGVLTIDIPKIVIKEEPKTSRQINIM